MALEPIPYYFESINRNAILIRPKEPFFNWLNRLFKDKRPITEKEECNIYLVREMDNNQLVEKWITKNFGEIFENELNDWYTDEAVWPQTRNYKMFKEWFDVEVHSMILDIEESDVNKD